MRNPSGKPKNTQQRLEEALLRVRRGANLDSTCAQLGIAREQLAQYLRRRARSFRRDALQELVRRRVFR